AEAALWGDNVTISTDVSQEAWQDETVPLHPDDLGVLKRACQHLDRIRPLFQDSEQDAHRPHVPGDEDLLMGGGRHVVNQVYEKGEAAASDLGVALPSVRGIV